MASKSIDESIEELNQKSDNSSKEPFKLGGIIKILLIIGVVVSCFIFSPQLKDIFKAGFTDIGAKLTEINNGHLEAGKERRRRQKIEAMARAGITFSEEDGFLQADENGNKSNITFNDIEVSDNSAEGRHEISGIKAYPKRTPSKRCINGIVYYSLPQSMAVAIDSKTLKPERCISY